MNSEKSKSSHPHKLLQIYEVLKEVLVERSVGERSVGLLNLSIYSTWKT